jgi:hypothetical protein
MNKEGQKSMDKGKISLISFYTDSSLGMFVQAAHQSKL